MVQDNLTGLHLHFPLSVLQKTIDNGITTHNQT